MRITYLHQYFATPEGSTGTRSYEFARRLVARGHEVTVIASSAHLAATPRQRFEGIDVRVIDVPYANALTNRDRVRRFAEFAERASFEAARHRADIVFATSTPLTIALPGLIARVARRAPLVFEVRDLWPEMPIAVGALRNPALIAGARGLEWAAYHGAAHVIALSPGMADGIARRGIPRERISMIPNGCDRDLFAVAPATGAAVRAGVPGLAPGAPLVVYVGALGDVNGVEWLADLAAELRPLRPDARFLVIGAGRGEPVVRARAAARGVLGETLFLRPPIAKRDVPAVLEAAAVATSLFAPIPEMEANSANKFFDALAAGRPLLINYGGWHRALLEETGAGIAVDHGDPGAGAQRLAALLADEGVLEEAREAARTLARERFDRDMLALQLAEVLERVGGTSAPDNSSSISGIGAVAPSRSRSSRSSQP